MGNFYMESTQINYRRDEKLKTVDQKLQELSETSAIDTDIAPVFKSTNTYQPGDMVYYRNKLYVFNVEHTGTWAAADVTATDVTTEISSLKSGLTNVTDAVGWSGHNYLVNDDHTEEKNGVAFTLNSDGTWTVDGTATADTVKIISQQKNFTFAGGKVLSGCPSISGLTLRLAKNTSPYTQYAIDSGNGVTIPSQTMDQAVAIIVVENGTHVDNAVVRPMISDGVIPYVPYHPVIGPAVEELQSGLNDVTTQIQGLNSVYKMTRNSAGDITFTTQDNRFTGFLLITGNDGKYAIYTINASLAGGQHIIKLIGDDYTITYSSGTITVTMNASWSKVTLVTDTAFA